jgi:hypothetical protein
MMVVLDAKSYNDPRYVVNVADFYSNIPSPSTPTPLFTYEITNPDNGDNWLFSLRTWNSPQEAIPLEMYPTLQSVHYNFADQSLSGNCTLKDSDATNSNTSTRSCMAGSFNPNDQLQFNITSAVPLNNTLSSSYPGTIPNATTALGIGYEGWAQVAYAPAVKLQQVNEDGSLGLTVLRTTVTRRNDITELKVCVNGVNGRAGATVQPEVLAPLGLILMRQADYALSQTQPHDNDDT